MAGRGRGRGCCWPVLLVAVSWLARGGAGQFCKVDAKTEGECEEASGCLWVPGRTGSYEELVNRKVVVHKRHPGVTPVFVDPNAILVQRGTTEVKVQIVEGCQPGDVLEESFADTSYDAATCTLTIRSKARVPLKTEEWKKFITGVTFKTTSQSFKARQVKWTAGRRSGTETVKIEGCMQEPCKHGGQTACKADPQCEWRGAAKQCYANCKEKYYGVLCDKYCDPKTTCHGKGTCDSKGECSCHDKKKWGGPHCDWAQSSCTAWGDPHFTDMRGKKWNLYKGTGKAQDRRYRIYEHGKLHVYGQTYHKPRALWEVLKFTHGSKSLSIAPAMSDYLQVQIPGSPLASVKCTQGLALPHMVGDIMVKQCKVTGKDRKRRVHYVLEFPEDPQHHTHTEILVTTRLTRIGGKLLPYVDLDLRHYGPVTDGSVKGLCLPPKNHGPHDPMIRGDCLENDPGCAMFMDVDPGYSEPVAPPAPTCDTANFVQEWAAACCEPYKKCGGTANYNQCYSEHCNTWPGRRDAWGPAGKIATGCSDAFVDELLEERLCGEEICAHPNQLGPDCRECKPNHYGPACDFCDAATTCSGRGICNSVGDCWCPKGFRAKDEARRVFCLPDPTPAPPTPAPTTAAPPTPEPTTAVPPTPEPTTAVPPTPEPTTAAPPTPEPTTAVPPTPEPTTAVPPTPEPTTAVPPTAVPPTAVPTTAVPPTPEPTTAVPPTAVPPTAVPTTAVPPTAVPTTAVPPTAVPQTAVPPTAIPPTAVPTTAVPPTAVPPTAVPPTAVPPTAVPTTAVPQTAVPPTAVPPTAVPPTAVPPTAVPPTAVPTTAVPPTAVPPTAVPVTAVPAYAKPATQAPEEGSWDADGDGDGKGRREPVSTTSEDGEEEDAQPATPTEAQAKPRRAAGEEDDEEGFFEEEGEDEEGDARWYEKPLVFVAGGLAVAAAGLGAFVYATQQGAGAAAGAASSGVESLLQEDASGDAGAGMTEQPYSGSFVRGTI